MRLLDIMGEDRYINAFFDKKTKQVNLVVTDDEDAVLFDDVTTVRGWESLVYFAQQIVDVNKRLESRYEEI